MKVVRTALLFVLSLGLAQASGYIGVYALIDKVVLEPNADKPERIQIFGVFSIISENNPPNYQPAQRGYLYFTLSDIGNDQGRELIHKEWADLKAAAGTHTVIAFGGERFDWTTGVPRLRKADEKPEKPQPYRVGMGLIQMRRDTDYPPVKDLLDKR